MKIYIVYLGHADEVFGQVIECMEKAFTSYDKAEQFRSQKEQTEGLPYRIEELDLD